MKLYEENFYIQRSNIYSSFLDNQDSIAKNLIVYLDVVFPMVFSYQIDEKIYLSYVVNCDEYEQELNIISTRVPNYDVLLALAESKVSVFDVFDNEYENDSKFFGINKLTSYFSNISLGDSCDKIPTLLDFHQDDYLIEDLLPDDDFYITRQTINKLNINEVKNYLHLLKRNINHWDSNYQILKQSKKSNTTKSIKRNQFNRGIVQEAQTLIEVNIKELEHINRNKNNKRLFEKSYINNLSSRKEDFKIKEVEL